MLVHFPFALFIAVVFVCMNVGCCQSRSFSLTFSLVIQAFYYVVYLVGRLFSLLEFLSKELYPQVTEVLAAVLPKCFMSMGSNGSAELWRGKDHLHIGYPPPTHTHRVSTVVSSRPQNSEF